MGKEGQIEKTVKELKEGIENMFQLVSKGEFDKAVETGERYQKLFPYWYEIENEHLKTIEQLKGRGKKEDNKHYVDRHIEMLERQIYSIRTLVLHQEKILEHIKRLEAAKGGLLEDFTEEERYIYDEAKRGNAPWFRDCDSEQYKRINIIKSEVEEIFRTNRALISELEDLKKKEKGIQSSFMELKSNYAYEELRSALMNYEVSLKKITELNNELFRMINSNLMGLLNIEDKELEGEKILLSKRIIEQRNRPEWTSKLVTIAEHIKQQHNTEERVFYSRIKNNIMESWKNVKKLVSALADVKRTEEKKLKAMITNWPRGVKVPLGTEVHVEGQLLNNDAIPPYKYAWYLGDHPTSDRLGIKDHQPALAQISKMKETNDINFSDNVIIYAKGIEDMDIVQLRLIVWDSSAEPRTGEIAVELALQKVLSTAQKQLLKRKLYK